MNDLNRRQVAIGLPVAALAVAALSSEAVAQSATPKRISLTDFSNDQRLVGALRRGVQVMRSRAPSDPTSWFFQGAIHAFNDRLFGDALLQDAAVGSVDEDRFWNRCPHFSGVGTADFLVWHRAYLYYFERILRDAAQEPDLTLPYWDYNYVAKDATAAEQQRERDSRSFPGIFAQQYLDPPNPQTGRGKIPNPLYHANREFAFVSRRYELHRDVAASAGALATPVFFSDFTPNYVRGLAGSHVVDDPDVPGNQIGWVEQRPHNDVHVAVGGVIDTNNGAMADVPTAAFDPVFWVHHTNIDRLWVKWITTPGKRWGRLPPTSWFDERPWLFYDFDKTVKNETRRAWFDQRLIGTAYDTDVPGARQLELPSQSVFSAQTTVLWRRSDPVELAAGPFSVSPTTGAQITIASPGIGRLAEAASRVKSSGALPRRALLVFRDIGFELTPSTGFRVIVSYGDRSAEVGTLALFGSALSPAASGDHGGHGHGDGTSQAFEITGFLRDQPSQSQIRVSVEPYDLYRTNDGSAVERRDGRLRFSRIELVEQEGVRG